MKILNSIILVSLLGCQGEVISHSKRVKYYEDTKYVYEYKLTKYEVEIDDKERIIPVCDHKVANE